MLKAIEVYSGKGVIAEALRARGVECRTVDLVAPADVVGDALSWSPSPANFVWASPPCTQFAKSAFPWDSDFGKEPSLEHVDNARRIIRESGAEFFCIENVRGAMRWLNPILGRPQVFGAICVWHNLPRPIFQATYFWKERQSGTRPDLRSRLPLPFARSVADAVVEALSPPVWAAELIL